MTVASPAGSVVWASGLTRMFGKRVALSEVSLAWGPGVHSVVGPNGAGKTTLLRLLALVDKPTSGEIRLFGMPMDRLRDRVRGSIGYLPQTVGVPFALSARDLVSYVARLRGLGTRAAHLSDEALELAGASGFADRRMRRLSGGERQRAAIAAAVVGLPELILLDEPTSGLDPEQRIAFRSLLMQIGATATVVVSTHLVEDVALSGRSVTVLNRGHVVFDGQVEDLAEIGRRRQPVDGVSLLEQGYLATMESTGANKPGP